jgi:Xaa-Pro aminopeptidase
MNRFERRLQSFRTRLQEKGCAGALLTPSGDMEYLLGVRRRRPNATKSHMHGDWLFGALITEQDCVFISPLLAHRFIEEQVEDKPWIDDVIMIAEGEPVNELARKLFDRYEFAGATVAVPREAMASTPVRLQELFPETTFQLTRDIVAPMRAVKDDYELERMRAAATVTDDIFHDVLDQLEYGMSETDIKLEVEYQMLKHNTDGSSFVTGIMIRGGGAAGELEGIDRAGQSELGPGRVLAFDFGVVLDGYVSDFGRTVYCG